MKKKFGGNNNKINIQNIQKMDAGKIRRNEGIKKILNSYKK